MPFTSPQQAKLDAAQKQLDAAKAAHQGYVDSYSSWVNSIQGCYKDQIPNAAAAATWFNALDTGPCTSAGPSCTNSSIANCKAVIEKTLNPITIPNLKSTYSQLQAAQGNYDKVLDEVAEEAAADPQLQLEHAEIIANAGAERLKQWFWIVLVIIGAIGTFVYFKWFRK